MPQAVILAAGLGSRIARQQGDLKPLRLVRGATLVGRNLRLLERAGVDEIVVVVGYQADALQAAVEAELEGSELRVHFPRNEAFTKANGLSVLTAAPYLGERFLLMMADHVFEQSIVAQALTLEPPAGGAILCIDRHVDAVFDLDDATKVLTDGARVLDIGKTIAHYNAIDTGLFVGTQALLEALADARRDSPRDDCSLSEGVGVLVKRGTMAVHDIGDARWQDVDTEDCLVHAEKLFGDDLDL